MDQGWQKEKEKERNGKMRWLARVELGRISKREKRARWKRERGVGEAGFQQCNNNIRVIRINYGG